MRIDLETHYSAHPLPPFSLPSYYRKTKLISWRAASFQRPPPLWRKEEALGEKQISIFTAIIGPPPPPPSLLWVASGCLLYLLDIPRARKRGKILSLTAGRPAKWTLSRSWDLSLENVRQKAREKHWHWGRDSWVTSLSLSLSLVFDLGRSYLPFHAWNVSPIFDCVNMSSILEENPDSFVFSNSGQIVGFIVITGISFIFQENSNVYWLFFFSRSRRF